MSLVIEPYFIHPNYDPEKGEVYFDACYRTGPQTESKVHVRIDLSDWHQMVAEAAEAVVKNTCTTCGHVTGASK